MRDLALLSIIPKILVNFDSSNRKARLYCCLNTATAFFSFCSTISLLCSRRYDYVTSQSSTCLQSLAETANGLTSETGGSHQRSWKPTYRPPVAPLAESLFYTRRAFEPLTTTPLRVPHPQAPATSLRSRVPRPHHRLTALYVLVRLSNKHLPHGRARSVRCRQRASLCDGGADRRAVTSDRQRSARRQLLTTWQAAMR